MICQRFEKCENKNLAYISIIEKNSLNSQFFSRSLVVHVQDVDEDVRELAAQTLLNAEEAWCQVPG